MWSSHCLGGLPLVLFPPFYPRRCSFPDCHAFWYAREGWWWWWWCLNFDSNIMQKSNDRRLRDAVFHSKERRRALMTFCRAFACPLMCPFDTEWNKYILLHTIVLPWSSSFIFYQSHLCTLFSQICLSMDFMLEIRWRWTDGRC